MTHPERRRAPRMSSRLPMVLRGETDEFQATAENISTSGVYCSLSYYLEPMTKLRVRLQLPAPESREIHCHGVVVRVQPPSASPSASLYHLAIFFNDLSDRDRDALARFVQHRLQAAASR